MATKTLQDRAGGSGGTDMPIMIRNDIPNTISLLNLENRESTEDHNENQTYNSSLSQNLTENDDNATISNFASIAHETEASKKNFSIRQPLITKQTSRGPS